MSKTLDALNSFELDYFTLILALSFEGFEFKSSIGRRAIRDVLFRGAAQREFSFTHNNKEYRIIIVIAIIFPHPSLFALLSSLESTVLSLESPVSPVTHSDLLELGGNISPSSRSFNYHALNRRGSKRSEAWTAQVATDVSIQLNEMEPECGFIFVPLWQIPIHQVTESEFEFAHCDLSRKAA